MNRRLRDSLLINLLPFDSFWKRKCGQHIGLTKQPKLSIVSLLGHTMVLNMKNRAKERNTLHKRVIISFSKSHQQRIESVSCCRSRLAKSPAHQIPFTPKTSSRALRHSQEAIQSPPCGTELLPPNPYWDLNNVRYIHRYIHTSNPLRFGVIWFTFHQSPLTDCTALHWFYVLHPVGAEKIPQ